MQLETKPHPWSCLATSFAMAMDITTAQFHMMAGHDGSEIVFPLLREPLCRRGFHISEACLVAMRWGYSATPIEVAPCIAPSSETTPSIIPVIYGSLVQDDNFLFFNSIIATESGVIECRTHRGNWHAVAFDHNEIFDPDGRTFSYSQPNCLGRGLHTTRLWSIQRISK